MQLNIDKFPIPLEVGGSYPTLNWKLAEQFPAFGLQYQNQP